MRFCKDEKKASQSVEAISSVNCKVYTFHIFAKLPNSRSF